MAADLCNRLKNKYYKFSAGNLNAAVTIVKREMVLVSEDIIQFTEDRNSTTNTNPNPYPYPNPN